MLTLNGRIAVVTGAASEVGIGTAIARRLAREGASLFLTDAESVEQTAAACRDLCSTDQRVDCVGACVGVRGSRIRNIIDEINNEKIDIIRWNDSAEVLIMNALKPADIQSITLYDDTGKAPR